MLTMLPPSTIQVMQRCAMSGRRCFRRSTTTPKSSVSLRKHAGMRNDLPSFPRR